MMEVAKHLSCARSALAPALAKQSAHKRHHLSAVSRAKTRPSASSERDPVTGADASREDRRGAPSTSAPASRTLTTDQAFRRMWTRADKGHVHGISGAAYTALGAVLMTRWASEDVRALTSAAYTIPALDASRTEILISLALATICALSGVPLSKSRGWRKTELSLRSVAFQLVLTWEALRFSGVIDRTVAHVPVLDDFTLAIIPFAWQTCTTAYVLAFTDDDKRSAVGVWLGVLGFGAQIFPAHYVLDTTTVAVLDAARPGLPTIWTHSLCGLIWLLNWSTFGASLRARDVVDDAVYRSSFLLRPSLVFACVFACDILLYAPFASFGDYVSSALGAIVRAHS